jgi:hypothetical protein
MVRGVCACGKLLEAASKNTNHPIVHLWPVDRLCRLLCEEKVGIVGASIPT